MEAIRDLVYVGELNQIKERSFLFYRVQLKELLKEMSQIVDREEESKIISMYDRDQLLGLLQIAQNILSLPEESIGVSQTVAHQNVSDEQQKGNSIKKFERALFKHAWDTTEEETPVTPIGKLAVPRQRFINDIITALRRSTVKRLNVGYDAGMETNMIMRAVMNQVTKSQLFDISIRLTMYDLGSVQRVQEKIAKNLPSMSVEDDEMGGDNIARKIRACLEKIKLLLVVYAFEAVDSDLKSIWKAGVPKPETQNSIKIVIVHSQCKVDEDCYPSILSEEEAWDLFYIKAGEVLHSQQFYFLAKEIVKAYKLADIGLPFHVVAVAASLRNVRDDSVWEAVRTRLTKGNYNPFTISGEIAYDVIGNEGEIRNCFLYCSLFQIDYDIDINELILYWYMEGFLDEENLGAQVYDKGILLLNQLLDRCLLERVSNKAVNITDCANLFFIESDRFNLKPLCGFHNLQRDQHMEEEEEPCVRISLINEGIESLPASPNYPTLTTLLLTGNPLKSVPGGFFEHMHCLQILNLSETLIESLPPSLSGLRNLRFLLLRRCKSLRIVSHIQGLGKLEVLLLSGCRRLKEISEKSFEHMPFLQVLDLSETMIESLPSLSKLCKLRVLGLCGTQVTRLSLRGYRNFETLLHVGETTNFEILDLSGTMIKKFPYKIVASSRLKHLDLFETARIRKVNWTKIQRLPERLIWTQCSLDSVWKERLSENRVCIQVSDHSNILQSLDKDNPLWTSLTDFYLLITPFTDRDEDRDVYFRRKGFQYRDIYFQNNNSFIASPSHDRCIEIRRGKSSPDGISGVLYHTKLLSIIHSDFVIRISDFGVENMMELKTLVIERCNGMVNVFGGEKLRDGAFSCLEKLHVSGLAKLKSVWEGSVGVGSFVHLKHVYLDCCPNLVNVFSSGLVLENLQKLEIKFCDKLEAIFGNELIEECSFPRLQMLCLWQLPEIRSICRGVLPELTTLKVRACMKLQELPLGDYTPKSRLEIRGESKWWNALKRKVKRINSRVDFKKWDHT